MRETYSEHIVTCRRVFGVRQVAMAVVVEELVSFDVRGVFVVLEE